MPTAAGRNIETRKRISSRTRLGRNILGSHNCPAREQGGQNAHRRSGARANPGCHPNIPCPQSNKPAYARALHGVAGDRLRIVPHG